MASVPCTCDPQTDSCVKLVTRGNCLDVDFILAGNPASAEWPYSCSAATGNGLHCGSQGAWVDPSACVVEINIPNTHIPQYTSLTDNSILNKATGSITNVTNPSSCYSMVVYVTASMQSGFELTGPNRAVILWGLEYNINNSASFVKIQSSRYTRSIDISPLSGTVSVESCDANCPDPAPREVTFAPLTMTIREQIHDAFGWTFVVPPSGTVAIRNIYDAGWVVGNTPGNICSEGTMAIRGIGLSMKTCQQT